MPLRPAHPTADPIDPDHQPLSGKEGVDEERHNYAHAGIQHTVEGVADIVIRSDAEQQQAGRQYGLWG